MMLCRDSRVLLRWAWCPAGWGPERICLLLDNRDAGVPVGIFEPADDEALLELLPQAALVAGLTKMREALARARRVIEASREERECWIRSADRQGMELEAFAEQSHRFATALLEFETYHGKGYPMTDDLTRGRRTERRKGT